MSTEPTDEFLDFATRMMRSNPGAHTIYKYTLDIDDTNTIEMPAGAKILSVQMQQGYPRIWALVDPTAPVEVRVFEIYGTGHEIRKPESLTFIATIQLHGGELVFHVFERAR